MHIQPPATATATVKIENGIQQQVPIVNGASRTASQPTLSKPQPLQLMTTTSAAATNTHHLPKPPALSEKERPLNQ